MCCLQELLACEEVLETDTSTSTAAETSSVAYDGCQGSPSDEAGLKVSLANSLAMTAAAFEACGSQL